MNPVRLTRRTAFRVAALFVALFSVTMIAVFAILYFVISRDLRASLKDQVDDLRQTLVSVAGAGGRHALVALVKRHATSQSEESYLVLTDRDGNYIAGNILPVAHFHGWKTIPLGDLPFLSANRPPTSSKAVLGSWSVLKNGHLFVALGDSDVRDVQEILVDGLGWAVLLTGAGAILGGLAFGLSAQRRVNNIEAALDAFAHGNLGERLRRSRSGDDLDHVAALINATLDRLQGLIGSVKQVTTDIAHDLKTPISRIRQKLEVALAGDRDADTYRAAIESTLGDVDQVVETFEALLRIAEIGAGARKAKFVRVDLKAVLANVAEALSPVAEDNAQTIRLDVDAVPDAVIFGDRQLLNQLFVNLVENAIRHCPQGSEIRILSAEAKDGILVHVRDNGPGIPEAERRNVLRPLYRLEKSRTTPGSGLGLSLAAAIADLHDGTLTLDDANPGLDVCIAFQRA